jgi:hypothetical protein
MTQQSHIAQAPPKCSDDPGCPHAGIWGATGVLPPGHIIYTWDDRPHGGTAHGAYLAHGEADPLLYEGDQS